MKFIFLLLITLMSVFQLTHAQKSPYKMGKIPQEHLEMTDCEFEPGAEAVVLAQWGSYMFYTTTERGTAAILEAGSGSYSGGALNRTATVSYKIKYNYHFRKKILTQEGLDQANIEIPYGSKSDVVNSINAQVHNVVGGKVETTKLKGSKIIDEDNGPDFFSYKKFALPNVKVGSIIEYSYTVISDDLYSLRPWYFQGDIPVINATYEGINDDVFTYAKMLKESHEIKKSEQQGANGVVNTWSVDNAPSLKEEDFVTNIEDYYSNIKFQLQSYQFPNQRKEDVMTSWYRVAESFRQQDEYSRPMNGKGGLSTPEIDAMRTESTQEEKLYIAYEYIQRNYKWDGGLGYFPNLASVNSKITDGATLNLLLLSTLVKLGIKAYPVLISTRDHGVAQDVYPFTSQFNHVIVYAEVDDKVILVDQATNSGVYNILPVRDLNGSGFLIAKEGQEWINVKSPGSRNHSCAGEMKLQADGTIEGHFDFSDKSYNALSKRREISKAGKEDFFKDMFKDLNEVEIVSTELSQEKEYNLPLKMSVDMNTKDYATLLNDFIYISPMIFEAWTENPFKLEERKYPVNFGVPISDSFVASIEIPEGYTVEELPEPVRVTLNENGGSFSYKVKVQENVIRISSRFKVNQVAFGPAEYQQLKEFFNLLIEKHAEQIILKKEG